MKYYTTREASKILGLHPNTLRKMSDANEIETIRISGQRRYNVDRYLGEHKSKAIICETCGQVIK